MTVSTTIVLDMSHMTDKNKISLSGHINLIQHGIVFTHILMGTMAAIPVSRTKIATVTT